MSERHYLEAEIARLRKEKFTLVMQRACLAFWAGESWIAEYERWIGSSSASLRRRALCGRTRAAVAHDRVLDGRAYV